MPRKFVTVPATAAALLVWGAPAAAESGPPGVWAAAAQYVEMMPTSTGPKAAGSTGKSKPLPPWIAAQLARRGGADEQALETLVTSSGWGGASITKQPRKHETGANGGGQAKPAADDTLVVPLPEESVSLPEATGAAVTGSSRGIFALAAVLAMLAAVALVRFGPTRT